MRILITNISLCTGTGTETFVRDLALAHRKRGHTVVCFAPQIGRIAAQIRAMGTPVVSSLARIAEPPEVIHGHHSGPTMAALTRFPDAQAIFVCHDWSSAYDDPPLHPRVRRYLYVRNVLRERLVSEANVAPERVQFFGNSIDLTRVGQPKVPPASPRVVGVYAHPQSIPFIDKLAAACTARGLTFRGELISRESDRPEQTLSQCDLVFASGRMAIEALSAGCAVINIDRFGMGGLITMARFDAFRDSNFAVGGLSNAFSEPALMEALDAYDACDVQAVTMRVRNDCNIAVAAERLEAIYQDAVSDAAAHPADSAAEAVALSQYLEENIQVDRIYSRDALRRHFRLAPEDELPATVSALKVAVDDLARQTRRVARGRIGNLFSPFWRSLLNRVRET